MTYSEAMRLLKSLAVEPGPQLSERECDAIRAVVKICEQYRAAMEDALDGARLPRADFRIPLTPGEARSILRSVILWSDKWIDIPPREWDRPPREWKQAS